MSSLTPGWRVGGTPAQIDVEWQAATAPNAADGTARLLIDGGLVGEVNDLRNGKMSVGRIVWGLTRRAPKATTGAFFLDDFASLF